VKAGKDTNVKSAGRAFDVLEFVAKADTAPSFPVLVQELAIPKSSLFNLLATLVDREYLQFVNQDRNRYQLGPRIVELAQIIRRPESVVERARPLLKHLSNSLKETSGYYERRGYEVICLATQASHQPLQYAMQVGQRVRLYANSCGKALLASMPDAELKEYLKTLKPVPYTPKTMTSVEAIRRDLAKIRKLGISKSTEEYLPGIVAFAVVVRDQGTPVGAINVAVPIVRINRHLENAIQRELTSVARAFEHA
jgi:IclR family transcriptional regulator, acetate operon repressor